MLARLTGHPRFQGGHPFRRFSLRQHGLKFLTQVAGQRRQRLTRLLLFFLETGDQRLDRGQLLVQPLAIGLQLG